MIEELSAALAKVLGPVLGADVSIENLRTLTGGASRTTWAFDAVSAPGRQALILRTGPPDDVHAGMELEARVQQRAAAAGAPVPHILAADNSPAALGNPYLICNTIGGETIVRRIYRRLDSADGDAGRERLLHQCAQALAAIHRADPDGVGLAQSDQLTEWRTRLDDMGDTTATFEWAFRWLTANRPPPSPQRLVHGDFRMGNLIVDDTGLAAVLDWELVHIGEVYEDLAWFCIRAWRFGAPEHLGAGGLGAVESFVAAYEAAGGASIDRDAFRWWLTLATLRWGVICRFQAERHLSGQTPSVELAAIGATGRRNRMGRAGSATGRRPQMNWLYGRPTAADSLRRWPISSTTTFGQRRGPIVGTPTTARSASTPASPPTCCARSNAILRDDSADDVVDALAALGYADEPALAAAIRAGELDGRGDVLQLLRILVRHRLAVAHPGYDQPCS